MQGIAGKVPHAADVQVLERINRWLMWSGFTMRNHPAYVESDAFRNHRKTTVQGEPSL